MLLSFMPHLGKCCVIWFLDNQNIVRIIEVGSNKPEIQKVALKIFEICRQREITLKMNWIPRSENKQADELSRIVDIDDWELNHDTFVFLENVWGPHSVDRFATWYNAKLARYNSICIMPGSEAVDAFAQSWIGENNWLVPPPNVIAKCIRKIVREECHATMIVPLWPSATFWPLLCNDGLHFNHFVVDWTEICPSKYVILKGRAKNTIFGGKNLPFRMVALRCMGKLHGSNLRRNKYFCSGAKLCTYHS